MKQYIVTIKHDAGTHKIRIIARNEDRAKEMVMASEGCPESAIIRVREAAYYKKY